MKKTAVIIAALAVAGVARAVVYTDATGEEFSGNGILDIVSVEILNDATDIMITVNVVGDINAGTSDWGKYLVGVDSVAGGDTAGNGLHVHFSVVDEDGKNIFDDGTDKGSEALQFAVGGLIKAMQESTLIFAPHQNSYRRMRPGSFAPISAAWGYENRSCAIRIPGGPHAARRIEHRVAGADANPYLMLAVILGAALIGIEDKILPPPPLRGNAYEANAPQLPLDWLTAIVAFSSGTTIARILDPLLVRLYAQAKHQELTHFLGIVSGAEYHAYLETV